MTTTPRSDTAWINIASGIAIPTGSLDVVATTGGNQAFNAVFYREIYYRIELGTVTGLTLQLLPQGSMTGLVSDFDDILASAPDAAAGTVPTFPYLLTFDPGYTVSNLVFRVRILEVWAFHRLQALAVAGSGTIANIDFRRAA